ncbi:MAG: DUF349 domain-containing protein [Pseudohongiellaceae bacterium]|nr:DUF349 domain-containing protein [Pseudohongiellaceae bacterium]
MIFDKFLKRHQWQDKDPASRIDAIRELGQAKEFDEIDIEAAAKIIQDLALNDPEPSVRIEAISLLSNFAQLQQLSQDSDEQIANAAKAQSLRIIAGAVDSELELEARLERINSLEAPQELLTVAIDCGCEQSGMAALNRLRETFAIGQEELLKIASESHSHAVRFAAAQGIDDLALLEKLCTVAKHKDRAVFKLCRDQIQAWQQEQDRKAEALALAADICQVLEALAKKPITGLSRAQYEYKLGQWQNLDNLADDALSARFEAASKALQTLLDAQAKELEAKALEQQRFADFNAAVEGVQTCIKELAVPLTNQQIDALEERLQALQVLAAGQSENAAKDILKQGQDIVSRFHEFEAKAPDVSALDEKLSKLTAKNTAALIQAKNAFYQLLKPASWPQDVVVSEALAESKKIEAKLLELLERNQQYLNKLYTDSLAHIESLAKHIEAGEVNEAQRMWDKVQGAIKNADEELKKKLTSAVAPYKEKVSELIDWKNFAASQKKKELIREMRLLIDDETKAPEKAKKIKALQEQWKALGHSIHNDAMWVKFNDAARKAFEPCKEYFKERKAKLHSNLIERNKICDELEALAAQLKQDEDINIAELNKSESKALKQWKVFAPVEQNKIKKLQKRFNAVLSDVRQIKRKTLQANAAKKLELIEQAQKLHETDDLPSALNEAKQLQAQWKTIGPSPYKDDRNHWNTFRAACDKLFNKRAESGAQGKSKDKKASNNPAVQKSRDVLNKINSLLQLSSEEIINTRKQFSELKDEFYETLTADLKHEKRKLQEQFDRLKKQYDSRLRAAPDRKSIERIGQLKTKSAFCAALEENVLAGKPAHEDLEALSEQWEELGSLSDRKQDKSLEQRFHAISSGVESSIMKKQAKENAEKAREYCISAEIHAGIDSPDADKALRMQVQLLQLKNSFGGRGAKSAGQQVNDLEMQLMCLGPLDKSTRNACVARLTKAKAKL